MCLNQLKSSTVFPQRSARALISKFCEKDGRLFEGERLIEGALIKRTRQQSSCSWEVYCIYQERSNRTKTKRREITHKKKLCKHIEIEITGNYSTEKKNYLPLLILLQSKLKNFRIKWQQKLVFYVSLLCKKVRGRQGGAYSRGGTYLIYGLGVGAYSGEGVYQSVDAYSRKYGIFENTRKSRPMPELQCIYQKHENKGTTTPKTNSQKIRIPSSGGYRCNCGSVNDIRKQGYHLNQFVYRLTSSCCLQRIQDGLDSGFHGDGLRILCQWILYLGFQSLVAFRNP